MNNKQYQELKNFDCRIEKTIATLTSTVNSIKNSLNNLNYQKNLIIRNNGVEITPLNFDTLDFLGGLAYSEGHTTKVTFPNGSGGSILDYSVTNTKLALAPALTLKGNRFVANSEVQDLTVPEIKNLLSYTKSDIGLGAVDNTSDLNKPLSNADIAALAAKAPLNSPTFIGTPTAPTPLEGDNSTKLATTAFVFTAIEDLVSGSVPDATNSVKGKLKLAGDLGGTADLPTVPELANKQATLVSGTNIKTINGTSLLGSGNLVITGGETNTASNVGIVGVGIFKQKTGVDLEFKKLNAGSNKVTITDDVGNNEIDVDVVVANLTGIAQSQVTNLTTDLSNKQETLVSGTNIKTINSTSLLGSGDISIDLSVKQTNIQFQNEGVALGTSGTVDVINFTGAPVTASRTGNTVTVDITGGGGSSGDITKVDDTNVTLTLGGTPTGSVLNSVSFTLGWTGTLADGRIASASNWNSAYTNRITSLTTTGNSGASTLISNVLNIPTYTLAGLGGISLTSLSSTATGLTYTDTTGVFSLTSGYVIPTTTQETNWNTAYTNRITSLTTTGSSGAATLVSNVLNIPNYTLAGLGGQPLDADLTAIAALTGTSGFLKTNGAGTWTVDTNTYLTGNQSVTLSGEASGSGTTGISVTLSNSAVISKVLTGFSSTTGTILATDSILQAIQKLDGNLAAATAGGVSSVTGTTNRITSTGGSNPIIDISASYVGQSSITTLGTVTTGTYQATPIADAYISSASTWNAKQTAYTNLTSIGTLANSAGVLTNNGSGTFSYTTVTSNATHTGDATGATALTVVGINGTVLSGLATGILKNTTGTGVPSIAVAGDFPTLNQNTTGSAATLTTGRTISITGDLSYTSPSFDGSGNVTAAGTLATVNTNTGTFGSATQVPQFTVNGKGLITAVSNITITPAASSITGGAALTKVDDTNVTLTLGGTPSTALLQATSITVGWTGTLADSRITSASNWNSKQAGIQFKDEGVNLGAANTVTEINFTGNGISASRVGNIITVDVGATSGVTNLTYTSSASNGIVVSDTGTDATIPAADGTNAGLMIPAQFDKLANITITQAVDLDALESDVADLTTLSGVASNSTTLGTFTGTTIPDSSTIKAALQSLETTLETNYTVTNRQNKIRVVSVNTTLSTTTDGTVVFDTAGTVATLPSPTNELMLVVKNVSNGSITVTGHLDGVAAQTFTVASLESFRFHSNGSTYYIIA